LLIVDFLLLPFGLMSIGFGDKKTYQQDPGNSREALREAELDVAEGADMLMIKPGMPYLDIIRRIRDHSNVPLAAYQVSGEYSMIKAAAMKNWLNEKETVLESLLCFRRAGADVILTYYAKDAAKWLFEEAHGGLMSEGDN
jgi:porphobilinogen synthase